MLYITRLLHPMIPILALVGQATEAREMRTTKQLVWITNIES